MAEVLPPRSDGPWSREHCVPAAAVVGFGAASIVASFESSSCTSKRAATGVGTVASAGEADAGGRRSGRGDSQRSQARSVGMLPKPHLPHSTNWRSSAAMRGRLYAMPHGAGPRRCSCRAASAMAERAIAVGLRWRQRAHDNMRNHTDALCTVCMDEATCMAGATRRSRQRASAAARVTTRCPARARLLFSSGVSLPCTKKIWPAGSSWPRSRTPPRRS